MSASHIAAIQAATTDEEWIRAGMAYALFKRPRWKSHLGEAYSALYETVGYALHDRDRCLTERKLWRQVLTELEFPLRLVKTAHRQSRPDTIIAEEVYAILGVKY